MRKITIVDLSDVGVNPFTASHDYSRFQPILLSG